MPNDKDPKDAGEHKDSFPKDKDFPDDDFLDSDFDHDDDPSFPDEDPKHTLPTIDKAAPAPKATTKAAVTPPPAKATATPKATIPKTPVAPKAPKPTKEVASPPAEATAKPPPPAPVVPPEKEETLEQPQHTTPIENQEVGSVEDMPLTVNVEVSRFSMSFKNLAALQKGNMVDIHTSAEAGVNLTINGKIIGKGELLKIGNSLGVRILEIGK